MTALPHPAIGASELIISPQNHIYHLDLPQGVIGDIIITVGDPHRVSMVSKFFDSIEYKAAHREFVSHTGKVGHKTITVVSTGIGPDNIDIVINELDALVNIDFDNRTIKQEKTQLKIFRLGTSGALQADVPVDCQVVSSFALGLDNLMHYYHFDSNPEELFILNEFCKHSGLDNSLIHPYIFEGTIGLRNKFSSEFHHGITATCPGFYGPQGRRLRGALKHPQLIDSLCSFNSRGHRITNFEMETSAIYGLSHIFGHQCVSVSAIIANRIDNTFSADVKKAVEKMIEKSLMVIEKI